MRLFTEVEKDEEGDFDTMLMGRLHILTAGLLETYAPSSAGYFLHAQVILCRLMKIDRSQFIASFIERFVCVCELTQVLHSQYP